MATLDESVQAKNTALQEAIDAAQKLIDDPNATADDAQAAMDAVKQIENEIKDLQTLQDAQPEETKEPAQEESDESSTPDAGSVVSEQNTEDDAPSDDESGKDNTDENGTPADGEDKKDEERSMPVEVTKEVEAQTKSVEMRDAFNAFMRSKGAKRDGLTSTDAAVVIPEQIIYDPTLELETVVDLAGLVTKTKVSTASGKYPILKRPSAVMHSVAELEENPDLAKPQFVNVNWEVETFRGQIPVSQESLDDAQVDLGALVAEHIQTLKINTTNAAIASKLATFTDASAGVSATTLTDDLKTIVNVKLDPAYKKAFIMTQSMYDALDKLKDNEGRYLLQDQIGSPSGKALFGLPVQVIGDNQFASTDAVGTMKLWVGDLRRAILFADRADMAVEWVRNEIYGRILEGVLRMDVKVADEEAGYMVELTSVPAA